MKASIIILTYNSEKFIGPLLESLQARFQEIIANGELEIIVGDNDSKDDTKKITEKHNFAKFVENGGNVGFAKGNNMASQKAKGDVLVFINPDARFVEGDLFEMIKEFDDEKVGVVGGKILSYDGKRELSCGKFYTPFNTLLLSLGLEEKLGVRFAPSKKREVDFVSGAFLAIRRDLFQKINGFDDKIFMYVEDSELCFRVKMEGLKVIFSPVATLQHLGQGSSNRTFAVLNIYKGLIYFQNKHMGKIALFFVKLILGFKAAILFLIGKATNNEYLKNTYEQAFKVVWA